MAVFVNKINNPDDRDFRPQTCTNGLVFRECKHIKNIFEDVYFTKNSFHITLSMQQIISCMFYLKDYQLQ
jgi:hypothetical protein